MTDKAAISGIPHGGGKSVIIRSKRQIDRTAIFRAFGTFLEELGGHYITAEDSRTSLEDMETIRTVTSQVTGIKPEHGGP
jgi:leucine dehydrogenase